jgi:hypothetical protein
MAAALVQPLEEVLKVCVDGQRPWFVHKSKTRTEFQQKNTAASSMSVSRCAVQFDQETRIRFDLESGPERFPIPHQVFQKFETNGHPLIDATHELAS